MVPELEELVLGMQESEELGLGMQELGELALGMQELGELALGMLESEELALGELALGALELEELALGMLELGELVLGMQESEELALHMLELEELALGELVLGMQESFRGTGIGHAGVGGIGVGHAGVGGTVIGHAGVRGPGIGHAGVRGTGIGGAGVRGAGVGALCFWNPLLSVAVLLARTTTVVGSCPTVCTYLEGSVLSTISVFVDPTGTVAMYIPVESVVKVCILSKLSVMTTLAPLIPRLPISQMPFPLVSSNMTPLILPVGWKPLLLVAVPPGGTTTVIGSCPAVCTYPEGASMSMAAGLVSTMAMYMALALVITVVDLLVLSVITTFTNAIPGSLPSWMPLPFVSWNTIPLILPVCAGIGGAGVGGTLVGGPGEGTGPQFLQFLKFSSSAPHTLPSQQPTQFHLYHLLNLGQSVPVACPGS